MNHCICCGTRSETGWCEDCFYHAKPNPGPREWEATYYSQHKQMCPFDVERNTMAATFAREDAREARKASSKRGEK